MEKNTDIETPEKPKGSKGKTAVIILLILLLGGSLAGNYIFWNKSETASTKFNQQVDSLTTAQKLKDSLYNMLAQEQASIVSLRQELSIWQNDNDSLKQLLAEKEAKIASLRAQIGSGGSPKKLRALKDSIGTLAIQNGNLKTEIQSLLMQNEEYKKRFEESESKNTALTSANSTLTKKVEKAAEAFVGPISVIPGKTKKGIFEPVTKAKKVEYLSISFDLLQNSLTEKPVEKEYIIRITDPNGVVLSNDNKSLKDASEVYTVKEKTTFDGTLQKVRLKFQQAPAYAKGRYKVELKCDDVVKQQSSFELQ